MGGGRRRTPNKSQHTKLTEEENSAAAPTGIQTRKLSITSPVFSPTSYPSSPCAHYGQTIICMKFVCCVFVWVCLNAKHVFHCFKLQLMHSDKCSWQQLSWLLYCTFFEYNRNQVIKITTLVHKLVWSCRRLKGNYHDMKMCVCVCVIERVLELFKVWRDELREKECTHSHTHTHWHIPEGESIWWMLNKEERRGSGGD